ncbi:MAG: N-acyl homoserine lactonase family protein [Chloroflexi bacterium]|nr:MAG: N-acyl homoserine lactonase family protein [Chloroflexota bacterium]
MPRPAYSSPAVHPLHLADVVYPEGHPRYGETGPVFAFLVAHPDGSVLVDTGIGPPHELIDRLYKPVRYPLEEALAGIGLAPADVRLIINTHLHFDHCGGNQFFPGRPILVQRREHESSGAPGYTLPDWVDFPGANYQLLDGDGDLLPGLRVVATRHTPGHQSVVVDTDNGAIVIAGQATETAAEFEAEQEDSSILKLKSFRPVRVLFSHDFATWPQGLASAQL